MERRRKPKWNRNILWLAAIEALLTAVIVVVVATLVIKFLL